MEQLKYEVDLSKEKRRKKRLTTREFLENLQRGGRTRKGPIPIYRPSENSTGEKNL